MNLINKKLSKIELTLIVAKIVIIGFVAIYLLGNFIPFYEGSNPYFYGVVSQNLAKGEHVISNELLLETGSREFTGIDFIITLQNSAVPISGIGLPVIGALFFVVGGYYGLFYLAPIFAIILLILSDRVATNLFGKYVGLLTILFLATSNLLLRNSIELLTESSFLVFFVLSSFCLVKFVKTEKPKFILLCSILLTLSAFIRINGVIFFPAEILIVLGYVIYQNRIKNKNYHDIDNNHSFKNFDLSRISYKKIVKISFFTLIPWLAFFLIYFSYFDYYFGDPTQNYGSIMGLEAYETSPNALLKLEAKNFENIKAYSKYLLPYQLPGIYNEVDENFDQYLGRNWLGIITFFIFLIALVVSLYTKTKRVEIIIFLILIIANVWFYSSITTEERADRGVAGRYMLPSFVLSVMIISFLIYQFFKSKFENRKYTVQNLIKGSKLVFLGILIVFFVGAFYFTPYGQLIKDNEFGFNDPQKFVERYPLDMEGLDEHDIILAQGGIRAIEYGMIPFNLVFDKEISLESVDLLRGIIEDGYDVYVFKQPINQREKSLINKLINQHGIVLKDYSKTFCELKLIDFENAMMETDKICIEIEPILNRNQKQN